MIKGKVSHKYGEDGLTCIKCGYKKQSKWDVMPARQCAYRGKIKRNDSEGGSS